MRRLFPLLLALAACNPSVQGTRPPANEPTPEQLEAHNKRVAELEAEAEARRKRGVVRPKLDVNTATREELLAAIDDLGDKMAHEIEEYRPYKSILVFRQELGKYVNEEYIELYEKSLYVPIEFDSCDPYTLMQIPGLTTDEVQILLDGRPYGSRDAFFAKLKEFTTPEQFEVGSAYVRGD